MIWSTHMPYIMILFLLIYIFSSVSLYKYI